MGRSSLSDVYVEFVNFRLRFCAIDPTRSFKNIVGDLGEHYACETYGLVKSNGRGADAVTQDLKKVEIKTRTNLRAKIEVKRDAVADLLLVLHLDDSGEFSEIYFGELSVFFKNAKFIERTNDFQMSIRSLIALNKRN